MRRLTAITLRNTPGQLSYVANQNMFNMFRNDDPKDQSTDNNATMATQTAAVATTGTSTLSSTYAAIASAAIPLEVTIAIKQLSANQTAIMQQMAAMSFSLPLAQHSTIHVPPIHNVQIPMQQTGGFQQGCGGGRGNISYGSGRQPGGRHGRRQHTPFANHLRNAGDMPPFPGQMFPHMVGIPQFPEALATHGGCAPAQPTRCPEFANPTKQFANWNICFTCRFNIEDGHTLTTCPAGWQKPNHQEGFTCKTAQSYINAGYTPCKKGMHKNVLLKYT